MQKQLEEALLQFIQQELEMESYIQPSDQFQDHSIESIQVLEIFLEVERQLGSKVSLQGVSQDSLSSLEGILNHVENSSLTKKSPRL